MSLLDIVKNIFSGKKLDKEIEEELQSLRRLCEPNSHSRVSNYFLIRYRERVEELKAKGYDVRGYLAELKKLDEMEKR